MRLLRSLTVETFWVCLHRGVLESNSTYNTFFAVPRLERKKLPFVAVVCFDPMGANVVNYNYEVMVTSELYLSH
jgi:hypothetical protein